MKIQWTSKALSDLVRLYDFFAVKNKQAAANTVQSLSSAPNRLFDQSRIGEKLDEFAPRDVRRIIIGRYEMRYEIQGSIINILRIWHTSEDR
ncbi:MAG: type II toxin-antitoxin system RelE/ParE family toxin [Deltaproteobacteria bacterium]